MLRMLARVHVVTLLYIVGIIAMISHYVMQCLFGKTVELGSRYELHVSWTVKKSHL